jgi:transcriptional regulator with XRE-family HTH domain
MTIPIGDNVKRLRAAAGLSQQALATVAGLSVSIVSQLEQGTSQDPRLSTLAALAKALSVTLDELAREGEEEAPATKPKGSSRKAEKGKGGKLQ